MQLFTVEGTDLLVIRAEAGTVGIYSPICPHQDYPLIEGELEDDVLTCAMHRWEFDVTTGAGVNPTGCSLKSYPAKVENGEILVDLGEQT